MMYLFYKLTVVSESVPSQIVESFRRHEQLRVLCPPTHELHADQSDQIRDATGVSPAGGATYVLF